MHASVLDRTRAPGPRLLAWLVDLGLPIEFEAQCQIRQCLHNRPLRPCNTIKADERILASYLPRYSEWYAVVRSQKSSNPLAALLPHIEAASLLCSVLVVRALDAGHSGIAEIVAYRIPELQCQADQQPFASFCQDLSPKCRPGSCGRGGGVHPKTLNRNRTSYLDLGFGKAQKLISKLGSVTSELCDWSASGYLRL